MPSRHLDRWTLGTALVGGACFGYLALIDTVGLWFHWPWMRVPAMILGALFLTGLFYGLQRDPAISPAVRRACWWSLWGLIGGYGLQVGYLWNRAGVLQRHSILPTRLSVLIRDLTTGHLAHFATRLGKHLANPLPWASLAALLLVVILLLLLAHAGAWHLAHALRDPGDPTAPDEDAAFVQRQRVGLLAGVACVGLLVALLGCDPRTLDYSEVLSLSWAQQHGVIFGFLGGFILESRRRPT
ncbi:MAG: hypothetical protein ABI743_05725 [bacterium]